MFYNYSKNNFGFLIKILKTGMLLKVFLDKQNLNALFKRPFFFIFKSVSFAFIGGRGQIVNF